MLNFSFFVEFQTACLLFETASKLVVTKVLNCFRYVKPTSMKTDADYNACVSYLLSYQSQYFVSVINRKLIFDQVKEHLTN